MKKSGRDGLRPLTEHVVEQELVVEAEHLLQIASLGHLRAVPGEEEHQPVVGARAAEEPAQPGLDALQRRFVVEVAPDVVEAPRAGDLLLERIRVVDAAGKVVGRVGIAV